VWLGNDGLLDRMGAPPPFVPDFEQPFRLNRRAVLKAAGAGAFVLLGGGYFYKSFWVVGPPGAGHKLFTTREYTVAEAIGDTLFPGPPFSPVSGSDIHLADFVDGYLAELYEDNQRLFKLLLAALNVSTLMTHASTFVRLSVDSRREVLDAWKSSQLLARRAGLQSLRFVYGMGYFENPRVRKALGLKAGCDLSGRLPEWAGGMP